MVTWAVPLISTTGDQLLIPADEVTGLLRHLTIDWLRALDTSETNLDPKTVLVLAGVLTDLADQIDVECIAFASNPPGAD